MVTIGMSYEVVEGKEHAFEHKFALVVAAMESTPGHVSTRLFRCVGAERSYLVVSRWSAKAAFDAFVASPEFRRVTAWGESGILSGRPTHQVYGGET